MRKLLQNKAVVAGLAMVAVLCIAGNFLKWPGRHALTVAARASASPTPSDPANFPIRPALQVAAGLADWRETIQDLSLPRDPFGPIARLVVSNVSTNPMAGSPFPKFVVQAISIEADKALAVVNRRVVSTGDQLEGYVVEQIHPTQVSLRGPAGLVSVPIRPSLPRDQKSATAK